MLTKILSAGLLGVESRLIEVEVDVCQGFPSFQVVGLPDAAIQESKERVKSAIKNCGFSFPFTKRVTVNLAPADFKKEGPVYDLPMAVGFLVAEGIIKNEISNKAIYLGELSLDGRLRPIKGVLSAVILAKEMNIKEIYLPWQNAPEASLVKGVDIIAVKNIMELISHINQEKLIKPHISKIPKTSTSEDEYDFMYIKGQEQAKRALEIVAAGGHSVFLSGPPGSGKTMLSKSLITILPPMSDQEIMEATKVHSIAGNLNLKFPLVIERPFRSPHHTASSVAIVGGGQTPKPGEISLAHRGVLFLDEFTEFPRSVLEALRQPLEDRVITVTRANFSVEFPADSILVAAYNPCPCGYLGDPEKECTCSGFQIANYQKKLSGPIMDRADIHIVVPRINYKKLADKKLATASQKVKQKIVKAREVQTKRFESEKIITNSEMTNKQIEKFCQVNEKTKELLKIAVKKLNLSPRGYFKILKISRTIADLDNKKNIEYEHVAEALQYRQAN